MNEAYKVPAAGAQASLGRRVAPVLLGLTLAALLANGIAGEHGLIQRARMLQNRSHLANEIEQLRQENRRLARQSARLRDDPTAIEALARGELGLIRPGERLFIMNDRSAPPDVMPRADERSVARFDPTRTAW